MILDQYTIDGLTVKELLRETGVAIKRKRINMQLTQLDLAERAGINVNTVIGIENGQNAGMDKFFAILRELGELPSLYNYLLKPEPVLPSVVFKTKKSQPQRVRVKKTEEQIK